MVYSVVYEMYEQLRFRFNKFSLVLLNLTNLPNSHMFTKVAAIRKNNCLTS